VLGEGLLKEEKWSGRVDSNHRPPHPQRGALPNCATARLLICLVARSWMLVIVLLPSRLPNTFILFFWTSFNTGTDLNSSFGPIRELTRG
jgi:hypothetical protein